MTRANRAHTNAVENFGPFAAVVLIAQFMNVSTPTTVAWIAFMVYAIVLLMRAS